MRYSEAEIPRTQRSLGRKFGTSPERALDARMSEVP